VPVPLYDLAHPSNTWHLRDAVDFDFPATNISAGGFLVVVSFDPVNDLGTLAAFRNAYNIDASVPIVGPYQGRLANNDEEIELRKPDAPNDGDVPYILVERVRYFDTAPWPTAADGTGLSLQRIAATEYGNDPSNWTAASPAPGPAGAGLDSDIDGMPNFWEVAYSLDPYDDTDAGLDIDGDGLTNLQEYQQGTHPRDASSGLHFSSIVLSGNQVMLTFYAGANLTFIVEYTDALGSDDWHELNTYTAVPANRVITFGVAASQPSRFYRLRVGSMALAAELQINSIQAQPNNHVALTFSVPANQSCTIESCASPAGPLWSPLKSYSAVTTNRVIQWIVPAANPSFYRLRSP
jgi:hypothetical protein